MGVGLFILVVVLVVALCKCGKRKKTQKHTKYQMMNSIPILEPLPDPDMMYPMNPLREQ